MVEGGKCRAIHVDDLREVSLLASDLRVPENSQSCLRSVELGVELVDGAVERISHNACGLLVERMEIVPKCERIVEPYRRRLSAREEASF